MNTFSVAEFSELNALLRAILAGKFSKSPIDLDVLDSKIVAKQAIQLADMVDHASWIRLSQKDMRSIESGGT
jgi:hypothetical protein